MNKNVYSVIVRPAISVFLLVLIDIVSFLFVYLDSSHPKEPMKNVPYLDHT